MGFEWYSYDHFVYIFQRLGLYFFYQVQYYLLLFYQWAYKSIRRKIWEKIEVQQIAKRNKIETTPSSQNKAQT